MNFENKLKRIQYIDFLILSKSACSLKEIAAKLNSSTRQVQYTLAVMRSLGSPLTYDRRTKRYYYPENKKLVCKYE